MGLHNVAQLPARVTVRALVVSSWRDAPAVLRKLSLWIWGVAVTMAVVALAIDVAGGWEGLPFATNLISEAVSAMIALPIALLVVSRLAAYQVEEATRQRLEARIRTLRGRLARAVQALQEHLNTTEREATASANDFIRAIHGDSGDEPDGAGIDLVLVNEAAWATYAVMSINERVLFQRFIRPVRDCATQLYSALVERMGDGEPDEEIGELERMTIAWESAVESHHRRIDQGQGLFGHRPALASFDRGRISELRNAAVGYIRSFDDLVTLCAQLEHYASPGAAVTPP
ncbi:hypothetical protein KZZ52_58245 [Dactylosporangium sp. AC04546]|uniref:hypothetical protein n=1 Tax=Dactylosporangium sp. AC04546 TaxID=2862460 RepID=UPI001EDDDC93|nr:hypothetical protein [Dactylosporangium sp. AC04546]WVK83540.1 hypothetical protein KZZ52_58245 [Dactylosporangium sp. AC04546]